MTCSTSDSAPAWSAARLAEDAFVASLGADTSVEASQDGITNHDGSYVLITYDDALRVESEAYRASDDSVIDNIEYTYDLDGNRTTRRRGPTIATSTLEEYTYAPGDELTTVSIAGTPTQTWEHDEAGRTTRIARSGHDQAIAYDADDHITSIVDGAAETRWQFDAEGRRTRREDLSGGITDVAHRYVVGPTIDASLESPHMVTTDGGTEELAYVFAPIPGGAEHPLFRYDPTTGEAVYYLQDSMGSVIGLVDQSTTQTATFEYDGFGGERSATGTLASLPVASRGDYRFHGMWLDSSVGLYYVRARVYDAEVGRFLSNDPAEGRRARPESFEGSRFALGRPFLARDPDGHFTLTDTQIAVMVISSLVTAAVNAYAFRHLLAEGRYLEFAGVVTVGLVTGAIIGLPVSSAGAGVLLSAIWGTVNTAASAGIAGAPASICQLACSFVLNGAVAGVAGLFAHGIEETLKIQAAGLMANGRVPLDGGGYAPAVLPIAQTTIAEADGVVRARVVVNLGSNAGSAVVSNVGSLFDPCPTVVDW